MRKRFRKLLAVLGVIVLGVLVYDAVGKIAWVGSTELTIEFVVTDADSGQPIGGAEVRIVSDTDRYLEGKGRDLRLLTDAEGRVRYIIPECMCGGTQSNLRLLRDRRGVNVPDWLILASAPGYPAAEPFWLLEHPNRRNVAQLGPRQDRLVVPISLRKSPP